jgi:transcriptional regulator with XRE-family HTH domain
MAGIKSAPELARRLGLHGSGATHLYLAERDRKELHFAVYAEIADVCGVPVEFFTADFSRLREISEDPRRVIAEETAAAVARSEAQRGGPGEEIPPQHETGP